VRILIADDEIISRRALEKLLAEWGHETLIATNGREAWDLLQEPDAPRLALVDWMMPEMDGMELCHRLREREKGAYVYVILLTARNRREEMLEGLHSGADDYLVKPWDAAELHARLDTGVRIVRLQEELIQARDALSFEASHDPLTRLSNRRDILEILGRELSRSRRQHGCLGVVLADIDYFKKVNDSRGHIAGDAVLKEASRRIVASVRSYDSVGRYGGEEFLIIVPSEDALGVLTQAERIRRAFEDDPFRVDDQRLRISLSLGVAMSDDSHSSSTEGLLRAADGALYRAKEKGRNRVEMADASELEGLFGGGTVLTRSWKE
jgi:two-component system, cell cycle response regulator